MSNLSARWRALPSVDFTPVTGAFVSMDGVSQKTYALPIVNDSVYEMDTEQVGCTRSPALGAPTVQYHRH